MEAFEKGGDVRVRFRCVVASGELLALGQQCIEVTAPQRGVLAGPQALCFGGIQHALDVEMALTQDQQTVGEMFRPSVPPDGGMLFDWGLPRESQLWMRNTLAAHRCDVIMGAPQGDDMVQVTNPYYRTAYALVFKQGQSAVSSSLSAISGLYEDGLYLADLHQTVPRDVIPLPLLAVAPPSFNLHIPQLRHVFFIIPC